MRFLSILLLFVCAADAQTAARGVELSNQDSDIFRYEYVGYRPARYETERSFEPENERPNEGGFVTLYYTNISDEPQHFRYWKSNGEDESHWRLGDYMVWDRKYVGTLQPGETDVIELNAVTDDYALDAPFSFDWVTNNWRPTGLFETTLQEDAVQIALIRFSEGRTKAEVHIRYTGDDLIRLTDVEVLRREVTNLEWRGANLEGPGHAIARISFAQPIPEAALSIFRVKVDHGDTSRHVYAHRRAFDDWFPIGTWGNRPEWWETLARTHIDLVVNHDAPDGEFYNTAVKRYGIQAMKHTGKPIRLADVEPHIGNKDMRVWMLMDEPDWNTKAAIMEHMDRQLRQITSHAPTFITLCRNVKFFEYAQIADIPCHDHYCIAAPTSSTWPERYGTRLEETAYYTHDLKYASEPKPIWVWTQGIADWGGRPQRQVPTPNEIAAQLTFNLGRGAKGIIWFNYEQDIAEKYPDAVEAMRHWGRVMRMTRNDFLAAEPLAEIPAAPDGLDAIALAHWDGMLIVLTNTNYELDPKAYPFTPHDDVEVRVVLPSWIEPKAAAALTPEGVDELGLRIENDEAVINVGDIEAAKIIALVNDPSKLDTYRAEYDAALHDETREYPAP